MIQQYTSDTVKISRILHAGYVFENKGRRIVFDPIFENPFGRNCYAFPSVDFDIEQIKSLKMDAIFISHFHDDHCSLESLKHLNRSTPIYMYCLHEKLFSLIRELGFKNVNSLALDQTITIDNFRITAKRALDEDVDSIFHIEVEGLHILNVVDSWIDYDMLDELKTVFWDLILWPFQTMREIEILSPKRFSIASEKIPPEWVEQLKVLKPKYLVPSSCQFIHEDWSWLKHQYFPISYQNFEKQINEEVEGVKVLRLNPSRSIVLTKDKVQPSANLGWVSLTGKEDVDYEYNPHVPIPTTAEVARNFVVTEDMFKKVYMFCEKDILSIYSVGEEEYFSTPKIWQLSIYNADSIAVDFFYLLDGDKIKKLPVQENIHWRTEVPMARLYGALHSGESLTSMYLRINDMIFSEHIESELKEVDILQDPLVRCLFRKSAISYQEEQFKRIKREEG